MTELDLYKFIEDNSIEWHRLENNGTPDIAIFTYTFHVDDFYKLVKDCINEGIECRMMNGYFVFWMNDICEYYGIELEEVFNKESWDA